MAVKLFLKIFALSFVLSLSTAVIAQWEIGYNTILGVIFYFSFTLFCLHFFERSATNGAIVTCLLVSQVILHVDTIASYFYGHLFSAPMLLLRICAIFSGYFYVATRRRASLLAFGLCILGSGWMFTSGWDYWIHKLNHGTFTGRVEPYLPTAHFAAVNSVGETINDSDLVGKIVVLDFWTTTCGICFEKFPQLERLNKKFEAKPSVVVLAVNAPIDEDKNNQAFSMIRDRGFTFPVVKTAYPEMAEKYGVYSFPKSFVLDRDGRIVYRGDIEGVESVVTEMLAQH